MAVQPIPDGYHSVTPYLIVDDAAGALEFYKKAFGAVEVLRIDGPEGKIGHAEFTVGDSHVMLASEFPEIEALAPSSIGGTPVTLCIYTENVDAMFAQAVAAGATELRPLMNQFYGDRSGLLKDPYGHRWTLATHIEDISDEELKKRAEAMSQQAAPLDQEPATSQ